MKQTVRYQSLLIPGKLRMEIRLVIDDSRSPIYTSVYNGDKFTALTLYPTVSISIIRPSNETDENGNRAKAPWNPNDTLGMTKQLLPIFINEVVGIHKDLKIPDLYAYTGKRLELNEEKASAIRRVFMIGSITLELSPVVIIQPDDTRVEGIKMKFNNEQSSMLLTLNDLESLVYNLKGLNIDVLAIMLYQSYMSNGTKISGANITPSSPVPSSIVDIIPKMSIEDELPI